MNKNKIMYNCEIKYKTVLDSNKTTFTIVARIKNHETFHEVSFSFPCILHFIARVCIHYTVYTIQYTLYSISRNLGSPLDEKYVDKKLV